TVPAADAADWSGMCSHGPLTTTVSDAALMLSVLAENPTLAHIPEPGSLRVAISAQPPTRGGRVPGEFIAAVVRTGELLAAAGHRVCEATPRYGQIAPAVFTRWLAGPRNPASVPNWRQLERRTRTHLRAGRFVRQTGLVGQRARRAWIARAQQ